MATQILLEQACTIIKNTVKRAFKFISYNSYSVITSEKAIKTVLNYAPNKSIEHDCRDCLKTTFLSKQRLKK